MGFEYDSNEIDSQLSMENYEQMFKYVNAVKEESKISNRSKVAGSQNNPEEEKK